ncbi:shikimate kinase [Edaphovirga cremea]|uniref:shikimate kinase n=1 Tax=Edaphovirga cremea TaxID=2267246 RepID=UPI000DEEE7D2|nr:shikimate kinase [Edaphovirga cremea]
MKINVIGTSGSGKSTLARRLAQALAIPYIEMDKIYWRKDWTFTPKEEFVQQVAQALEIPDWVLDGNYKRTQEMKWRDVDWVVWVDYGFCRTLWQAVRRATTRLWRHQELWPDTGNYETLQRLLFSRESIVLWTIKTYRPNRDKYLRMMADPRNSHIRFIHLRCPADTERFVASVANHTVNPGS